MATLKVGIIGCGRIASILEDDPLRGKPCTHAGGFSALRSAKIVAACDVDADRLKKFGKRWGVSALYEKYEELLASESIDIACVSTWTRLHAPITIASARAGVKGVFCEKPIALNLKEARGMIKECEKNNVILTINHERRWDPYYQQAKKLIQTGTIGEVKTIIGSALSWKPPKASLSLYGGGPMFHDGTHLTDLLTYFCGKVDWVSACEKRSHGKKYIEETASAMLGFKNGVIGFIQGGGERNYFSFELDIQGSEGRILIGNGGRELFVSGKSGKFTGFKELKHVPFPEPKKQESPFIGGAKDVVQCIQKGKDSLSSGRDGLEALKIIDAVYRSAQQGGKRLKILPERKPTAKLANAE